MKQNLMLTIASVLSILFMTFHLTSDTIHAKVGTPEAGGSTLVAVPILVSAAKNASRSHHVDDRHAQRNE